MRDGRFSRKISRRVARQRNQELRDLYIHKLSEFETNQLVFIDESGCDKKVGQRRWGWAPRGCTPVQINSFNRDQRYQILPAYTVEGVLLARVYSGSTDTELFNDFIEQLLQHCGRWPEPRSVLVMDNATFHCSDKLKELCEAAGVKLLYLPPYSPDFNPIEEFFAELKAYIKKHWNEYKGLIRDDFKEFLRHCIDAVGKSKKSA
jgi:transposase